MLIRIPILKIQITEQASSRQTETSDVALQVSNRYIQALLSAKFSIYSSYKIEALVDSNNVTLGFPAEYFDYLAWASAVDGFGGGEGSSTVPPVFDVTSTLILLVIIIVVAIVGLYIFFKLRKKAMPINISLNK